MWVRVAAWLGRAVYVGMVLLLFGLAAYLSFSLFVRSGATSVPDLSGLTLEEAEIFLADHGLKLRHPGGVDRFDTEVEAGGVLAQDPGPRTLVKRDSEVEVVLSLGPHLLAVADVVGSTLPAAQVTLAAAGLAVGRVVNVYSVHGKPGTVVEQDPPAGSNVAPATPVHLLFCVGNPSETYLMPDLIYRQYDVARRFFERRGVRLGSVKFEPYEGVPAGVILRQFPLAGHPLRRQDAVSLVVAAPDGRDGT